MHEGRDVGGDRGLGDHPAVGHRLHPRAQSFDIVGVVDTAGYDQAHGHAFGLQPLLQRQGLVDDERLAPAEPDRAEQQCVRANYVRQHALDQHPCARRGIGTRHPVGQVMQAYPGITPLACVILEILAREEDEIADAVGPGIAVDPARLTATTRCRWVSVAAMATRTLSSSYPSTTRSGSCASRRRTTPIAAR